MLRINTQKVLVDFKGEPLKGSDDGGNVVRIGRIIANVLGGKTSNPTKGWILGRKFASEKFVDLLAEDIVFIKAELNANATSPTGWLSGLMCGQIIEILDGQGDKEDDEKPAKGKK